MKKIILSVTAIAIAASTIFVACKKDEVKIKNESVSTKTSNLKIGNTLVEYSELLDSIGDLHNEAMDHWYNYATNLKANNWTGTSTQLDDKIKTELTNFFSSKGMDCTPYQQTNIPQTNLATVLSGPAYTIVNSLDSVADLFGSGLIPSQTLVSFCNAKIPDCFNLSNPNEADQVGIYCAVMKASTQYWTGHLNDFIILYNDDVDVTPSAMSDKQRETLKADAQGGLWGAGSGAVAGGVVGAIVGGSFGAAYASTKAAYKVAGVFDCWLCP